MGPVGPWELIIILAVAILLFGPSRFSGLGRAAGNMMREFREALGPEDRKNSPHDEVRLKKS
jgi:sec-independent protein translocase protein TatA